ncbi:DUF167 domain-containing protein [Holosporaceae bacterium 'Namur']|nr:DUF167 domain-containing protein [Holosporaceae bacterium 'Namur']
MPKKILKINVKVSPQSRNDEVLEFLQDMDNRYSMKVRVKAPPQGGEANEAIIKLLSKYFDLAKSNIEIILGAASKQKVIRIVDFSDEIIVKKVQKNLFT